MSCPIDDEAAATMQRMDTQQAMEFSHGGAGEVRPGEEPERLPAARVLRAPVPGIEAATGG
eukprot:CAMPEP_0168472670 /NCGR_PEP_ID=MMETSP0228-20121227/59920_1 /TAXON_ID=133427 /ORGANISM="Protoceratium reticulatum, Strain CCCM 535 (=CCMP 1889)" /LENGTH=60 /DNA_ID=CAMNT_0008488623 /DNA_START=15 /DNA_END=197 /DNA_ORIENTATION=-